MKKKIIITSVIIGIVAIYSILAFILPKTITDAIAMANFYTIGSLILGCLVHFLLMDNSKTVTISTIIHTVLTLIAGIISITIPLEIRLILVIELVLIFAYIVSVFAVIGTGHVDKKEEI